MSGKRRLLRRLAVLAAVLVAGSSSIVAAPSMAEARQLAQDERWSDAARAFEAITASDSDNGEAWYLLAYSLHAAGRYARAIDAGRRAVEHPRWTAAAWYNLACAYALSGKKEDALSALDRALQVGFNDRETMRTDVDLRSVRDDPRFRLPAGRTRETFRGESGTTVEYARVLPAAFDPGKSYPTIVALGPGSQSIDAAEFMLDSWVGGQASVRGWLVVAPAAPGGDWTGEAGTRAMAEFLKMVDTEYDVAGDKFHLVGCSNGGNSAFYIAQQIPERFHSLTVLPGSTSAGKDLERLQGVRVVQYVGENDGGWVDSAKRIQGALKAFGINSTLHVVPDGQHVLESLMGDALIRALDDDLTDR